MAGKRKSRMCRLEKKTGFLFLQGKHNTGFYEKLPKDQTNL